MNNQQLLQILETCPFEPTLIEYPKEQRALPIAHAPKRICPLNTAEKRQAISNILRYVPAKHHQELAQEFAEELEQYGHIYAYRFMPNHQLNSLPIDQIPCKTREGAAIVLMILNNLDPAVAQFPQELVTYGGNGQVFSNWIQFRLVLRYLYEMSDEQTLSLYSGHPLGLFPSHKTAPRVVITNGMMIPNYSTKQLYDKFFALGVTQYGQMTAGSYCYIGPQGIVHGTTITVMNAGRKYLGVESLAGKVFVTAGLGGMSGAQAKAAVISGCVGVIAEISEEALLKRHKQGWLDVHSSDLNQILFWIREYRELKKPVSIGYHGNVVDLWERLAQEEEQLVELGSDQTSCHNPFNGGYYPVGISFAEANALMASEPDKFKQLVQKSLLRQIAAIEKLAQRGMYFWDYGNAFLVECHRAGAKILAENAKDDKSFKFPSYMQDIMGEEALLKRHKQGWLDVHSSDLNQILFWIREYRELKKPVSIGYHGNVVDLWERLAQEEEQLVELGSDQTSCHNPFNGGYYPVGISFAEANALMASEPDKFKQLVQKSLLRQIAAIEKLAQRGMYFWDYGNAFLVECHRAGAKILAENAKDDKSFKFPSYMQDIMG
uniref:Urocanate hydratase n=1 Tax=Bursaphelenchus xylophilus TaxID=6326 RepID=A0A1I7S5B5_BURXY